MIVHDGKNCDIDSALAGREARHASKPIRREEAEPRVSAHDNHSSGVLAPLARLQGSQATHRFSTECGPPRDQGMM